MRRRLALAALVFGTLFAVGCGGKRIQIVPTPGDAEIYLNDTLKGTGLVTVELENKALLYELRVGGVVGFFDEYQNINFRSPSRLLINLKIDNSYKQTVDGTDVVNRWISLPVADHYDIDEAWRKLTSSVTAAISDFEAVDQKSLYLKTAWQVAGRRGDFLRTRSRIIVNVENADPEHLTFKIKIETHRINSQGDKVDTYSRTFQDFLDAVAEARSRLER
jgi:hypothetical protein